MACHKQGVCVIHFNDNSLCSKSIWCLRIWLCLCLSMYACCLLSWFSTLMWAKFQWTGKGSLEHFRSKKKIDLLQVSFSVLKIPLCYTVFSTLAFNPLLQIELIKLTTSFQIVRVTLIFSSEILFQEAIVYSFIIHCYTQPLCLINKQRPFTIQLNFHQRSYCLLGKEKTEDMERRQFIV